MKIALGTTSTMKVAAVQRLAGECWPDSQVKVVGLAVVSGVPETPFDQETYDGARQRAVQARSQEPQADLAIGIESGLVERYGHVYEEAWAVCLKVDGSEYAGYSSGLRVPDSVLEQMKILGKTHAEVMSILEERYGRLPNDTWSSYTGGTLLRQTSLEEAVRNTFKQVLAPVNSFYRLKPEP